MPSRGLRVDSGADRTGPRARTRRGDRRPHAGAPVSAPTSSAATSAAPTVPADHRHLLHLVERRIECVCESCWALRSGDAEYRPTGSRTTVADRARAARRRLGELSDPDRAGLLHGLDHRRLRGRAVPEPRRRTESELHFSSWSRMVELNPVLADLEPDIEGLIVNRLSDPPAYVIAPIDRCYALTGTIKANWEGISGGAQRTRGGGRLLRRPATLTGGWCAARVPAGVDHRCRRATRAGGTGA